MLEQTILWKQLDSPGHDACGLWSFDGGWRLVGAAMFRSEDVPCHLRYEVECDTHWRTRWATVHGLMGTKIVRLSIDAASGWSFNGRRRSGMDDLVDVDLGFTPATNLIQLRRLDLDIGQGADAPVAYLRFPELTFGRMEQRYHRVAHDRYDYESPRFGYAAVLRTSEVGFVVDYPGLWQLESLSPYHPRREV